MTVKRSRKSVLFALVAILLLSLPVVASAQTGTQTQTGSAKAAVAATNGITAPKEDATVRGMVEVRGFAEAPNFMKWQLDLLPNGDPNAAIFLALGEKPGEFTYSLDATKLPAGEHALRLRVVGTDSNYKEYLTRFMVGKEAAAEVKATKTEETTKGEAGQATTTSGTTTAATTGSKATTTSTTTKATTTKATTTQATTGVGVTENGFAAPTKGETLQGNFEVKGFANDPSFMKWQLDLLPEGNANSAVFLALGEKPGVFTYTLNTTELPAGNHELRLRVVRADSNYTEYLAPFVIGKAAAAATTNEEKGAAETKETATTEKKETTTTAATTTAAGKTTTSTATKETTASESKATPAAQAKEGEAGKSTAGAGVTTNGIAAPTQGETIRGVFDVRGYANDPNFMKWQLDLLPNADANAAIFLALGEKPGEFTYKLDTLQLPAGKHALRLRIVRNDSNYSEYVTDFTVAR